MTLDVDDIGSNRSNLIELPDATLTDELPSEVTDILIKPIGLPQAAGRNADTSCERPAGAL